MPDLWHISLHKQNNRMGSFYQHALWVYKTLTWAGTWLIKGVYFVYFMQICSAEIAQDNMMCEHVYPASQKEQIRWPSRKFWGQKLPSPADSENEKKCTLFYSLFYIVPSNIATFWVYLVSSQLWGILIVFLSIEYLLFYRDPYVMVCENNPLITG